jgi:hypothetical protein
MIHELTTAPLALLDPKLNYKAYSVYGVKIGDDYNSIPRDKIQYYNNLQWFICEDDARFKVWERKVYLIKVPQGVVKWLNMVSPGDIEAKLGNPSDIEDGEIYRRYIFREKGVKALWSVAEDKLAGIVFGEF